MDNTIKIKLAGRIDSGNAAQIGEEIDAQLAGHDDKAVVFDAEELEYISSAGLRVLLHVRKNHPELKIMGVSSDVYEILEMTGFTEMMEVEKAYRVVSVEGCEVIGEGANGKVYRIDRDNVVKTYKNADALNEIQHEREVARLALILGVPTAISYDVVKVDDSYGSVFELLDAKSFAKILAEEPDKMDWCVDEYVKMLKKIHSIDVPEGKLPHIKNDAMEWVNRIESILPADEWNKLKALINEVPQTDKMIHGDYHTKNIVLAGNEVLLIDMDTLSVGYPIFEFGQMYNAYLGFSEYDQSIVQSFQGFSREIALEFWNKTLRAYFGTDDESKIQEIEDKIRCAAYARLIDWGNRHLDVNSEEGKATIERWKSNMSDVLKKVDSLDLGLSSVGETAEVDNELDIEATVENLDRVQNFVLSHLDAVGCTEKAKMQIEVAVEEVFVNIASYAYNPETGNATVRVEVSEDEPIVVTITFIDKGIPYDPLARMDPDITLPAEERGIGGLGILMTKKMMDDVSYEYKDGQNILTLVKKY